MGSRSSILVNFRPGVIPKAKNENVGNALDSREPDVTNCLVTTLSLVSHRWLCSLGAIGMRGYTPVGITGVLVLMLGG